MCGLSFSGKSTFAALLAEELDADLVSLDAINAERGLFGGQSVSREEWARTNEAAQVRAAEALRAGRAAVVDDTGSPRFIRDGWRAVAEATNAAFSIVWVQIDPERQRQRLLANRSNPNRHDVVEEVMAAHVASFESPAAEDPLIVDADDAASPQVAATIANRIPKRAR